MHNCGSMLVAAARLSHWLPSKGLQAAKLAHHFAIDFACLRPASAFKSTIVDVKAESSSAQALEHKVELLRSEALSVALLATQSHEPEGYQAQKPNTRAASYNQERGSTTCISRASTSDEASAYDRLHQPIEAGTNCTR